MKKPKDDMGMVILHLAFIAFIVWFVVIALAEMTL